MILKRISCLTACALAVLGASADLPLKLVNNSKGEFADSDIYVAIFGKQGDKPIYYDLAATGAQKQSVLHPLNESVNTLHHDDGDWGYANVFTRMSDIQDQTIYLGNTHACRVFFAFKSPMYLHAFADGGYTGADMNNPNDPNADIRWELIEFTYEPEYKDFNGKVGQIWINTTRVDAFQYPMGLELYSKGGLAGSTPYIQRGEIVSYQTVIDRWNQAYGNTVYKDCYSNPIGKDTLGGIIKQPSKVEAVKYAHIFDEYIDRIWNYFRTNTANIRMGILGRWEGRVEGDAFVLKCVEGTYWAVGSEARIHSKPTTEDAIEGAGCFAEGTDVDKTVQSMFCAAFNRGQFRTTTAEQNWDPVNGIKAFTGGSEFPCNEYVKFFHDTAITASDGHTYSFAYDDTFEQSATCYSTSPMSATVTIGGFYDGQGGTITPNPGPEPGPEPSTVPAAPKPAKDAEMVKSFFSNEYPSIAPGLVIGTWGQTTQGSITALEGNDAYKFTDFNYLGLQVSSENATVDVADMEYLHLDLYAEAEMDINIFPISLNPTVESDKVTRHLPAGEWTSIDLPLSDFPAVDFAQLGQFKFDGGSGETFYLDNIYMWKEAPKTDPEPVDPSAVPAAPKPAKDAELVKSFFSNEYPSIAPGLVIGTWGQTTQGSITALEGNDAYKFTDFNYLGLQVSSENATVDVADMEYLHLDLYAEAEMDINIYPVSLNPTVDSDKATRHLPAGAWTSIDLPLSDFPAVDFAQLGQFKFDGGSGETFYLDNIYTWKEGTIVTPPTPPVSGGSVSAAPAPAHSPEAVKSFFSDRYESAAPEMIVGNWGQSTRCETTDCDGDNAYRLTDFNYLGLQVSANDATLDISDMEKIHIDLYATENMVVDFHPIALNPTYDADKVTIRLNAGEWMSFDFALSEFPGMDFSRLGQFKFVDATPAEAAIAPQAEDAEPRALYLDNLYAWTSTGNTPTGIDSIKDETQGVNGDVYDLFGRFVRRGTSVDGLPRGIYIVGGRKIAVTK